MSQRLILFLCTGNYYRSRYAETLFNALAVDAGIGLRATSRGLALERGVNNVGPIAKETVKALEAQGIHALVDFARFPQAVTATDFESASLIVALSDTEHRPLMEERHPDWIEKIEYWTVDDAPEALKQIDEHVRELVARFPREKPLPKPVVCVGRETKGRRGKGVTIVWDIPLEGEALQELAATLKNRCGTGGTVKDGRIEIQGDQRERLIKVLDELGYKVKKVGG